MQPLYICLIFVFLGTSLLIGLYIGLSIRYHFWNKGYQKYYASHPKNILTDEEKEKYAPHRPGDNKQKHKKTKRKDRKKQKSSKEKNQNKEQNNIRDPQETLDMQERSALSNTDIEQTHPQQENLSAVQSLKDRFADKNESINLKDRIGEREDSFVSFQCGLEGENAEDKTKEIRKSQDQKYNYSKTKENKGN